MGRMLRHLDTFTKWLDENPYADARMALDKALDLIADDFEGKERSAAHDLLWQRYLVRTGFIVPQMN